jgi:hypothetical protein
MDIIEIGLDNKKGHSLWVYGILLIMLVLLIFAYFIGDKVIGFYIDDLNLYSYLLLALFALICEFFDSTLGMGYGTTLTPLLILFGIEPLTIIPAVLFSEFVTGIFAGVSHHIAGNVDFHPGKKAIRIATVIAMCSVIGVAIASFVALRISKFILTLYIGLLVFIIGLLILILNRVKIVFTWFKIIILGLISSFNKGMSGGGYGPVLTGGQILSGIESKGAIGITSLAEGITCFAGIIFFYILGESIVWRIALPIMIGAILSVPVSALAVKRVSSAALTISIGILCLLLGILTILKLIL